MITKAIDMLNIVKKLEPPAPPVEEEPPRELLPEGIKNHAKTRFALQRKRKLFSMTKIYFVFQRNSEKFLQRPSSDGQKRPNSSHHCLSKKCSGKLN